MKKNLTHISAILLVSCLFSCQEKIQNSKKNERSVESTFESYDNINFDNVKPTEIENLGNNSDKSQKSETIEKINHSEVQPNFTDKDSLTIENDSIRLLGDANINTRPFNLTGLLVYYKGNQQYSCSCQFVDYDIVITAAHCVFDLRNKNWYDNFIVYQGYKNGTFKERHAYKEVQFPVEYWKATKTHNIAEWDYAFIKLHSESDYGHFGIKTLGSSTVNIIGYPSNIKSGQILQVDYSKSISNRLPYRYLIAQSNFGKGSSGGAWYDSDYYVRSVTSMKFSNGYIAGAVFRSKVIDDLKKIQSSN